VTERKREKDFNAKAQRRKDGEERLMNFRFLLIGFLLSDACATVTGSILTSDGGYSL
jgi:hypothetical protein